jgi:pimeloyl-ACP methyl ester carboxylesterase
MGRPAVQNRTYAADPRFGYHVHRPTKVDGSLAVVVHGTDRAAEALCDAFASWAERNDCIVVAPVFPVGVLGADDRDSYKSLSSNGFRYDEVLLGMLRELRTNTAVEFAARFLLFGFSGGAQFAHRFCFIHPERVAALSIGAPGNVTLLDSSRDWWVGTRNAPELFEHAVDAALLRQVPLQAVIGEVDDGRAVIEVMPGEPRWMPGANDAGRTRRERLTTLLANLSANGLSIEEAVIPGAGHQVEPMIPVVQRFFTARLEQSRNSNGAAAK